MLDFLKICGLGLLYTLLLPFFIIIFALYFLYATAIFIFNIFKGLILFFKGINITKEPFKEDILAANVIENRKQMLQNMQNQPYPQNGYPYQNVNNNQFMPNNTQNNNQNIENASQTFQNSDNNQPKEDGVASPSETNANINEQPNNGGGQDD